MPKPPQDIYARHLLSPRGYPLWTPEPSHQLLAYRRDGLRIGDVGVVIPEDGCFDVFFNLCLPESHSFHQATGVPDNFEPILLNDMDIRTVVNAENPGRIIATSSVKTVRSVERSGETSSRMRSPGLEYEFSISSSEGALLILPEGAERHDLRNHHRFLEAATQHGADWYRFAEEKVGQIIGHDSLYLITGLYKTRSWSLAAFEKTAGTGEYPAQFKVGGGNIAATCTWDTTRALDWRVGPIDNYGIPNQAVFIRGFKIARRAGVFRTRWISVKADAPSTRPNSIKSSGTAPGESWLAYVFGGSSTGKTALSTKGGAQDGIAADPALDAARNEIQNNGALAVGEDIVIQRVPEASEAFHPSDIINQYLLNKESSADIAITHDDEWITLLEENLLRSEDMTREGLLETLVSRNYHILTESGAVYLRSSGGSAMEARGLDSEGLATAAIDARPSTKLEDDTTRSQAPRDINRVHWPSSSQIAESNSAAPLDLSAGFLDDDGIIKPITSSHADISNASTAVALDSESSEENPFATHSPWRFAQMRDSPHRSTPEPRTAGVDDRRVSTSKGKITPSTLSAPQVQPRLNWTNLFTPNPSPLPPVISPEPLAPDETYQERYSPRPPAPDEAYQRMYWGGSDVKKLYGGTSPAEPGKIVRGTTKFNPLLSPKAQGEHPNWIMRLRAQQDDFGITSARSWVETRNAPAIEPHARYITIISRTFPGIINARAQDPELGVTCGEVLDAIFSFLDGYMQWEEYERFMRERHKTIAEPSAGGMLKRITWLGNGLLFGGLVVNDALERERMRNMRRSGRVFELRCLSSAH